MVTKLRQRKKFERGEGQAAGSGVPTMSLTAIDLPPPRTWQAFESLCHDLFSREWGVTDASRIGRNGQRQHGVDIVAHQPSGWVGVQCKWISRTSELTPIQLREIAREARKFEPSLSHLVVATTLPNDAPLQREARLISEEQTQAGLFPLTLSSWDDLVARLDRHPDVFTRHYVALAGLGGVTGGAGTDYASRIENFRRQYVNADGQSSLLVGREAELAELDYWLADPTRPYGLIRAPAGRGKSALLANWAATLGDGVALIYMPISVRFRTNLAQVVFTSLLSRLCALHDRPFPSVAETNIEQARGAITDLLARPVHNGVRLLMILDGLDEAADFEVGADLFPASAPPGLKVLLAGRPVAFRPDPLADLAQGALDLPLLSAEVVRRAVSSEGESAAVADQIARLADGDPLVLRLYLDALAAGVMDRSKMVDVAPGLRGFFAKWWDDQLGLWRAGNIERSRLLEGLLCVLACALGPLSRDDLLDSTLVPECPGLLQLDAALTQLGRLIVTVGEKNEVVLAHPRFGDFVREEWIPTARRSEVEQRYLAWGERSLRTGMPASVRPSAYVIKHFGAHLERAHATQDRFVRLTSRYWADLWYSIDPSLSGFLADVDRRRRAATSQIEAGGLVPSLFVALVTCALVGATVRTIANGLSPNVYVAALQLRIWSVDTVIEHMGKVRLEDFNPRALAEIARIGGPERSHEVLALALSIGDSQKRIVALAELLPLLAPTQRALALRELLDFAARAAHWQTYSRNLPVEISHALAEKLEDAGERAYVLASTLPSLTQAHRESTEAAIEDLINSHREAFVEGISYHGSLQHLSQERRLRVVAGILERLNSDLEKRDALREIAFEPDADLAGLLLRCAESIGDEVDRGEALAQIASSIPVAQIEAFLAIARRIERPWPRARSLAALGAYHAGPWSHEAIEVCGKEALHSSIRAPIIIDACRHLSDAERLELEVSLLADLNTPVDSRAWDEHDPDWLLADFAETFQQTSPDHALRLIQEIGADDVRALQAARFALRAPAPFRERAMEMLRNIQEPSSLIEGFVALAAGGSSETRAQACAEIVELCRSKGHADYLVSRAVDDGWDLERELGQSVVRRALALHSVGDWNELSDAMVALSPETSRGAAVDAFAVMRRIGYEFSVSRIARAFADKFSEAELRSLFSAIKIMPSRIFAASILGDVFPQLAAALQSEALEWVRKLPEETPQQIEDKIRFLTACESDGAEGPSAVESEVERLLLTLPPARQGETRAAMRLSLSPGPPSIRRNRSEAPYSREGLIAQVTRGEDLRRAAPDYFQLLREQEQTEIETATIMSLQATSAGKRSSLLRLVSRLAPSFRRLGGVEVADAVVAALRENVETWG